MFEVKDGNNHKVNINVTTRENSYLSRQSELKKKKITNLLVFGSTSAVLTPS